MASLTFTASITKLSLGRTPLASLREPFVLTELDSCTADCLSALSCAETKGVARKGQEAPKISRLRSHGDDGSLEAGPPDRLYPVPKLAAPRSSCSEASPRPGIARGTTKPGPVRPAKMR
jgi:hypothetical protein